MLSGWLVVTLAATGDSTPPHWAFVPPTRPMPPATTHSSWPRNAIDAFVLQRLGEAGLQPAPEAPPETLLRRLALDLTGLPPAETLMGRFLADPGDEAYGRVVDDLLSSRIHAERQAQDWLDLARYADSNGFADDGPRAIWPYRDWVVDAFARNIPFDRFTLEQLAGDLLPGATTEQRIASGFHRNSPQAKGNTYPVEEYRLKGVVDRVNTTGTTWLGLTVGCAECHDHRFDPITQREYFSLLAIFNNVVHTGEAFAQDGPSMALPDPARDAKRTKLARQADDLRAQLRALDPPGQTSGAGRTSQAGQGGSTGDKPPEAARLRERLAGLDAAIAQLDREVPRVPVMEELPTPRATRVHVRGDFLRPGETVRPGVPAVFGTPAQGQPTNRLELARWLVDGRHPLTARVAVNRLWQACFGQGLVTTPADFGIQGDRPSHPELLDWLACELVSSGWNLRHVHRLIVTSATYRQSARNPNAATRRRDPMNRWLARAPRPRLPAEQLRDQALAVAGTLDLSSGGQPVFPVQPDHYWEERALPGRWVASVGTGLHRRSLYTYWRRMALHPTLEILDAPARTVCTPRRTVSNVPTQALVTLNDPVFTEAAAALAGRLLREMTLDDPGRIDRAFRLTLGRRPEPEERTRFLAFVTERRADSANAQAVWTSVATVLLNLDEFLCRP